MHYELYIDILFLENLIPDILILWLMRRFLGYSTTWARIFFSALVGSAGACMFVVIPFFRTVPGLLVSHLGISVFMVWLGFRVKKMRMLVESTGVLYALSLLFAGIWTWLSEILPVYGGGLLLAAVFVCFLLTRGLLSARHRKTILCPVTISYRGSVKEAVGLWDTGNCLRDPLHQKPVCVVERNVLEPEISEEVLLFPLAYHSLGNAGGSMMAVVADQMTVEFDGRKIVVRRPVLAIAEERLSGEERYKLILNPGIIDK